MQRAAEWTVPDHGVTVRAKAEGGDSAVVALQHAHTPTGAQIPHTNAAVQRRGEELQPADVRVELHQAAKKTQKTFI